MQLKPVCMDYTIRNASKYVSFKSIEKLPLQLNQSPLSEDLFSNIPDIFAITICNQSNFSRARLKEHKPIPGQ